MKCEDNPDLGANSGATYSWNNKIFYLTNITVTCPIGLIYFELDYSEVNPMILDPLIFHPLKTNTGLYFPISSLCYLPI